MIAVLDTNVIVQSVIGAPDASSAQVIKALKQGKFVAAFSPATLDELIAVLLLPNIRRRHNLSPDDVTDIAGALSSEMLVETFGRDVISPSVTRDRTDVKFLATAVAAAADFLVTNDRRHLLRLRSFQGIRIVTPAEFLNCLADGE